MWERRWFQSLGRHGDICPDLRACNPAEREASQKNFSTNIIVVPPQTECLLDSSVGSSETIDARYTFHPPKACDQEDRYRIWRQMMPHYKIWLKKKKRHRSSFFWNPLTSEKRQHMDPLSDPSVYFSLVPNLGNGKYYFPKTNIVSDRKSLSYLASCFPSNIHWLVTSLVMDISGDRCHFIIMLLLRKHQARYGDIHM